MALQMLVGSKGGLMIRTPSPRQHGQQPGMVGPGSQKHLEGTRLGAMAVLSLHCQKCMPSETSSWEATGEESGVSAQVLLLGFWVSCRLGQDEDLASLLNIFVECFEVHGSQRPSQRETRAGQRALPCGSLYKGRVTGVVLNRPFRFSP